MYIYYESKTKSESVTLFFHNWFGVSDLSFEMINSTSSSGPIESWKENQLYANKNLLRRLSLDSELIVEILSVWETYFNEVAHKSISKETVARIDALREKAPDLRFLPNSTTDLPNRSLPEDVLFSVENKMSKIICPVLFQFLVGGL